MKTYLEAINTFLDEDTQLLTPGDVPSLLDVLYRGVCQTVSPEPAEVTKEFDRLEPVLQKLTVQEQDAIMGVTCRLCDLHKGEAFRQGVLVGFRLFRELTEQEPAR